MTGFESKRRAALEKLKKSEDLLEESVKALKAAQAKVDDDADTLTIVYQRGFADGKRAAQRQWVGLDEDDIRKLYGKDLNYRDGNYVRYAMAVEAKLKERNT